MNRWIPHVSLLLAALLASGCADGYGPDLEDDVEDLEEESTAFDEAEVEAGDDHAAPAQAILADAVQDDADDVIVDDGSAEPIRDDLSTFDLAVATQAPPPGSDGASDPLPHPSTDPKSKGEMDDSN
jgi:hypothetical protein